MRNQSNEVNIEANKPTKINFFRYFMRIVSFILVVAIWQYFNFNPFGIKGSVKTKINYDIDSLSSILKSDTTLNVYDIKFNSADSGIFIIDNPKFDYSDLTIANTVYSGIIKKYAIPNAKNISYIAVIYKSYYLELNNIDYSSNDLPFAFMYCNPNSSKEQFLLANGGKKIK